MRERQAQLAQIIADIHARGIDCHADVEFARHDLRHIERRRGLDRRDVERQRGRRSLRRQQQAATERRCGGQSHTNR